MNQLSSLLTDGALYVSNSMLESYTCPRRFEYLYVLRRESAVKKASLTFGDKIHQALALRYRTDPHHLSLDLPDKTEELLRQLFEGYVVADDEFRTFDHASRVMRAYNSHYGLENFEVVATAEGLPFVEQNIITLLHEYEGIPIYYISKVDMLVIAQDQPWVWDHKTSTIAGPSYYQDMSVSPQQDGYCWSVWRSTGIRPAGYCINMLPVNAPSKTGKVKLKPNGFYAIEFERPQTYISEGRLLDWERNTCLLVENIIRMATQGEFPMMRHLHCVGKYGACPYFDVCSLPEEQRGVMLSSGLFADKIRSTDNNE